MKRFGKIALVLIALFVLAGNGFSKGVIAPQQNYLGVAVGQAWGLGISANFEHIAKKLTDLNGYIGVGAEIGYASHKDEFHLWGSNYGYKYTYIPIFGFASYHFGTKSALDPYIRLGLGYIIVSDSYFGESGYETSVSPTTSYLGLAGQVGLRYQVSPNLFVRAALGMPWIFSAGVDFRLK